MTVMKKEVFTLLIALLFSTVLAAMISIEVSAQQEMTPEWVIEKGSQIIKLAVSADGKYIAAATNNTKMLYAFRGNESLWYSPVDYVHSLAMSADGKYIVVGTKGNFYFFDIQNSTPQLKYQLDYENSLVAISGNGNIAVVGTTPYTTNPNAETKLYLFEKEKPTPTWNNTFPGILESLSISSDGNYIVASTSQPGVLYLLAKEQAMPLWTYNFGGRSGGAKISNNGNYIIAVGGNQTSNNMRIYRFLRQSPIPQYIKAISELPSLSGLSTSANGSIFAISYTGSNQLIMFNLELPPYGYGPGSVLTVSLPSRRVSMSMSLDGRHIIVGTVEGIFAYEYLNRKLDFKKQYTVRKPFITDIASSANGQFIIAAAMRQNNKYSTIYLFDNFQESQVNVVYPWLQLGLIIITIAVVLTAATYILRRKTKDRTNVRAHAHGNKTFKLPFFPRRRLITKHILVCTRALAC